MYYRLLEDLSKHKSPSHIKTYPILPDGVSMNVGRQCGVPLPKPLEFVLHPGWGTDMLLMYASVMLLLREDLVAALNESGVSNLDTYAALIRDPRDAREYSNYKLVNIIGLVKAVDLKASEFESFGAPPLVDALFSKTVIDNRVAGGILMFRMAESVMDIIVHERIRECLVSRGFSTLEFLPCG